MAYSRWATSVWYTYADVNGGFTIARERNFTDDEINTYGETLADLFADKYTPDQIEELKMYINQYKVTMNTIARESAPSDEHDGPRLSTRAEHMERRLAGQFISEDQIRDSVNYAVNSIITPSDLRHEEIGNTYPAPEQAIYRVSEVDQYAGEVTFQSVPSPERSDVVQYFIENRSVLRLATNAGINHQGHSEFRMPLRPDYPGRASGSHDELISVGSDGRVFRVRTNIQVEEIRQ